MNERTLRLVTAVVVCSTCGQSSTVDGQQAAESKQARVLLAIEMADEQSADVSVAFHVVLENVGDGYCGFRSGLEFPNAAKHFEGVLTYPSGEKKGVLLANWAWVRGSDIGSAVGPGEKCRIPMIVTLKELPAGTPAGLFLESPRVPLEHAHLPPGEYRLAVRTRKTRELPGATSPEARFRVVRDADVRKARLADLKNVQRFPKLFTDDLAKKVLSPDVVLAWCKCAAAGPGKEAESAVAHLRHLTKLDARSAPWLVGAVYAYLKAPAFSQGPATPSDREYWDLANTLDAILQLLAEVGDPSCAPAFAAVARSKVPHSVRARARFSLASIWSPEAIPLLIGLLDCPEEETQVSAAVALSRRGRREGYDLLVKHATDRSSKWRLWALAGLAGNREDAKAQEVVRAALQDQDRDFAAKLEKAIAQRREADERARRKWQSPPPEAPKPGQPQQ